MTGHFRHRHEDENTGTSHQLTVDATPGAHLKVAISVQSPKAQGSASSSLPRYRVRALHHMLGEWLESTKDWDVSEQNRQAPPSEPPK